MIPRRFRNWVIFWTIVVWVVLELLTYPKTVPITSGFSAVIKGFFSASVGGYPAWVMLLLAVICAAAGIVGLVRRSKAVLFNVMLLVEGFVLLVWGVLAGGGFGGFSGSTNSISYNWALQTVAVIIGGLCVWFWAVGQSRAGRAHHVEHAPGVEALSRQLAGHGRPQHPRLLHADGAAGSVPRRPRAARPQRADQGPRHGSALRPVPPADRLLLQLVRHRPGGPERARPVHLERAHLAHGRSARRVHVHRPRRRHRHRRRLLRRLARRRMDALNRRVPGHPVAAVSDGACRRLGPELLDDHPDHRHHQLAGHRTRRAFGRAARA